MYRTDFWTLWEKARVGCFERTACILSIVKQITRPGGMHETSTRAWCTGKTQWRGIPWRGRWEGGSWWGIHVTPWLIHVNVWQNPLKGCEVISLQLIKINEKKERKKKNVQRSWIDPSLKIYLWPMHVYKRMMKSLDMQIKTTMTYHLLEWLSSKRQGLTSRWGHGEWEPLCTVDGNGNWCSHYGNSMQIPLKTKNRTTYDPAIPLLGT